jgi:hypothetical protein
LIARKRVGEDRKYKMAIYMRGTSKLDCHRVKVHTYGRMVPNTKVNFTAVLEKVKDISVLLTVVVMLASLLMKRQRGFAKL